MDYEKKYNEILAWAKKYKARLNGVPIEDIFPELRESEDERIRKAILGLTYIDGIEPILTKCSITAGDIRAWLEKQKDASKAIEAVERIDKYIDERLAHAHDMKDSNPDKKYYRGWDDALGKMAGILQDVYSGEKQKEQKELPLMDGNADLYFDEWNQQKQNPTKRQCFEEGIRYARRLQQEQKPAEWSEEDEKIMQTMIKEGDLKPSEIAWLKSLRPQPKQEVTDEEIEEMVTKRARSSGTTKSEMAFYRNGIKDAIKRFSLRTKPKQEWSDKDECILKGIIGKIDHDQTYGVSKKDMLSFLEALRPSWKPSEEQMEALRNAAYEFGNSSLSPYSISNKVLASLYEQLKKLM